MTVKGYQGYDDLYGDHLGDQVRLFRAKSEQRAEGEPPEDPEVVLCLQGGGARAAYQVGVYQALSDAGLEPDWVIGMSSGALNGAVIAGNPRERRLSRLEELWRLWRSPWNLPAIGRQGPRMQRLSREMDAFLTSFGKPHFYWPRLDGPMVNPGARSFFEQSPLRRTLRRMVDFEYLQQSPVRLSVGCADVEEGTLRFFDSRSDIFIDSQAQHLGDITALPLEVKPTRPRPAPTQQPLGVDHLMAAAAYPPGADAVKLDGRLYWDGGVLDNSPLDAVIKVFNQPEPHPTGARRMVFVVDLWARDARPPRDALSALWRRTELEFASAISTDLQRFLLIFPRGAAEVFHLTFESPHASPIDPMDFTEVALDERRRAGREQTSAAVVNWQEAPLHSAAPLTGRAPEAAVCYRHYHGGKQVAKHWGFLAA